jgi:hypothetical protein
MRVTRKMFRHPIEHVEGNRHDRDRDQHHYAATYGRGDNLAQRP